MNTRRTFIGRAAMAAIGGVATTAIAKDKKSPNHDFDLPPGCALMNANEVEALALAAGAVVVWVDEADLEKVRCGQQLEPKPQPVCPPCLLGLAVVIIAVAIWYAACQAKKRERQLPPE